MRKPELPRAWLARLLDAAGITKKQLADALGLPPPRVSDMLAGRRRIQAKEIPIMAKLLGLEPAELLRMDTTSDTSQVLTVEPPTAFARIPVVGSVEAGYWSTVMSLPEHEWSWIAVPMLDDRISPTQLFALTVRGQSMDLIYPEGTLLVCMPIHHVPRPLEDRDHVIVRHQRNGEWETTVKEYRVDEDGSKWLVPHSSKPSYQAIKLPTNDNHDNGTDNDGIAVIALVYADFRKRASI
ncbi:LexA family protein [Tistrella mobilis]